ncbi:TetR/AcrR family transcriptional regulator [Sphingomonas cavernae]|uniref:TetR/AcrR family transcriptional regulator n=1 Tax=Sphingomonas cavernae TaxID=2320861 RepID=A0A418WRW9_9SPHN|nr:TetR/AcrR family transcriptional regulator [Sphingomonas cavernae]RJF93971.1 TetR/AcrR family transcriptional regulator [Sphingomonas cavernae]
MTSDTATTNRPETARFQRKRELILDAAAAEINENGARGMTLADVAAVVGLNTTSVTYYFKRKEVLAAACYDRSLDRIEAIVATAERATDPRSRVRAYVEESFAQRARIRQGEEPHFTVLSDLRAMDGPERDALADRYRGLLRRIRGFFGATSDDRAKALLTARTHVLVETIFWLPGWVQHYATDEFPRLAGRMFELFDKGLAPQDAVWTPVRTLLAQDTPLEGPELARRSFLKAATRLINERGYRGASVDRIASELNVTKGSFYHHLDAKDELVVDCFAHSFETLSQAQRAADRAGGSQWERICSAIAMILDVQFSERGPLLRTTALQALPPRVRGAMVERSDHVARRFAGMMIDGISEGSVRAVDPLVASQTLVSMLNAAYELHNWADALAPADAIDLYASTLAFGLFDDRMLG